MEIPTFLIEEMEKEKGELRRKREGQIPLYLPLPEIPLEDIEGNGEERKSYGIIVIEM